MGPHALSHVRRRWIVIAGATALAVAAPIWLLRDHDIEIVPAQPIIVTVLPPIVSPSLDMATIAPPFSATRSDQSPAATGPASLATDASATPTPAPAPAAAPKLVGTVIPPRGKAVALVRNASAETMTISVGDDVDGWRIARITRSTIAVTRSGERLTLALDYGNAPTTSPPVAPTDIKP